MYTMDSTYGNSLHFGLTAEVPLTQHLTAGFQVDHSELTTFGWERYVNVPQGRDYSFSNGVGDFAYETMLTVFLQLRI